MINPVSERQKLNRRVRSYPERYLLRDDIKNGAKLLYFVPFRDFYGGWLIYELNGIKYRQWAGNATIRRLFPDLPHTTPI
ncbi:MAG: hypothetical protein N2248_00305 [candidate division WOR-3 bacterium]|nr:hypothetical protein [candidate division WOR-3 bacterium]